MPETPDYYEVVNWSAFQHYRARRPAWIKNYIRLQDKVEYRRLPDVAKAHLHGIWLLAARLDNRIPNDPEQLRAMMGTTTAVKLEILVSAGFLKPCKILHDSESTSSAKILETETYKEETEKKNHVAPDGARVAERVNESQADQVRAVLAGCEFVTGRKFRPLAGRVQKIKTRLREGYTVEQLIEAMRKAHEDPFYRGENDRGRRYDRPETVFKTAESVEQHLEYGGSEEEQSEARIRERAERLERAFASEPDHG